jgi:hypothetical protein
MALAIVQRPLSGSTDGLPIEVSATAGGATTVHTMVTGTTTMDRVFMWAGNTSTADITLILEWGASADRYKEIIPAETTGYPVLNGQPVWGRSGSISATVIKAHASTSAVVKLVGYVNRITES